MSGIPLLALLQAAQRRVVQLPVDPSDFLMISRTNPSWTIHDVGDDNDVIQQVATPAGDDVFPPKEFDQFFFDPLDTEPDGEWVPGVWVMRNQAVLLVRGTTWPQFLSAGADLMRSLASRPRRDRLELSTVEAWQALDRILTPYTASDGLRDSDSPPLTLFPEVFGNAWSSFMCELLLSGTQGLPATHRWRMKGDRPWKCAPDADDWKFTEPMSISAACNAVVQSLVDPLAVDTVPAQCSEENIEAAGTPDVDRDDLIILRAIRKANRALTQSELQQAAHNSRRTIGKRLAHLRSQGLTEKGKQGELLTAKGVELVRLHDANTTQ